MEIKGPRSNLTGEVHHEVSAARLAMWNLVAHSAHPLTAASAADLTQTHVNTAREHLEGLHRSGVVRRVRHHAGGRGRPSWAYELITPPGVVDSEYAGLATALARQLLRLADDPQAAAREAGEEWGRELAREHVIGQFDNASREREPDQPDQPDQPDLAQPDTTRPSGSVPPARKQLTPSEIAQAVLHVLTSMGFAPEIDADDPNVTRLTLCPLLDASLKYPQVVCQVHSGLMTGIMRELGGSDERMQLMPFAEPGACLVTFGVSDLQAGMSAVPAGGE